MKVKDLRVIEREEGLVGRVREIPEEDLVLILFCTERSLRKEEGWLDYTAEYVMEVNAFRDFKPVQRFQNASCFLRKI